MNINLRCLSAVQDTISEKENTFPLSVKLYPVETQAEVRETKKMYVPWEQKA